MARQPSHYHRTRRRPHLGDDVVPSAKDTAFQQVGAALATLLQGTPGQVAQPHLPGAFPIPSRRGPSLATLGLLGGAALVGGYFFFRRRKS